MMYALTMRLAAGHSPALRAALAAIRAGPAPPVAGLAARWWVAERRGVRGRYLFRERADAERLAAELEAGAAPDPAVELLAAGPAVHTGPVEEVRPEGLERPVFLLAAPRAGGTMLYDLLARSPALWSLGGESHGPIEGVPALGPAARGYRSHRLTELDATPEAVETVRCGLALERTDAGGTWLLEKTPENALRVPFLRAAFPDARFVCLFRDARENVSSIVEAWGHDGFVTVPDLPGWPGGAWHLPLPPGWEEYAGRGASEVAALQWAAANRAILDDLATAPDGSWCAVEYRELVDDPEATARRLCAFLGIPFDGALAAAARRPLPLSPTAISTPSPTKWRFNRAFDSAALDGEHALAARVRAASTRAAPQRVRPGARVRFHCFLDELDGLAANGHRLNGAAPDEELVVDPALQLQLGATIPLPLVRRTRFRERFLAGHPLAWVEDHASGTLRPFWVSGPDAWRVAGLIPGREPNGEVPPALRAQLARAGILAPPEAAERRRAAGDERAELARERFRESGYCLLSDLLHPGHVGALRRYYRSLVAGGNWELGDAQVAGRYGWHNEPLARFFHHQLSPYVSRVAGERVRPTYVYVSAYQGGAVLERHLDREQCKYTMSLAIDESPEDPDFSWPLHFETPGGTVSLVQALGDAVLFRGDELPHYRDRLADGRAATALLFHFVPDSFVGTHY